MMDIKAPRIETASQLQALLGSKTAMVISNIGGLGVAENYKGHKTFWCEVLMKKVIVQFRKLF